MPIKPTARIVLGILAIATLVGCQTGSEPGTCSACGDGAIVCTATVADCIADNGGSCTTKIGATGAGTITFKADGSYIETSENGTDTGTWSQDGNAIVLNPVKALLSVYENGAACPYAPVSK